MQVIKTHAKEGQSAGGRPEHTDFCRSARELCELATQVRYRGDVACAMHIEWWCSWQGGDEEQQTHLTSELTHAATLQKGKRETSSTPVLTCSRTSRMRCTEVEDPSCRGQVTRSNSAEHTSPLMPCTCENCGHGQHSHGPFAKKNHPA